MNHVIKIGKGRSRIEIRKDNSKMALRKLGSNFDDFVVSEISPEKCEDELNEWRSSNGIGSHVYLIGENEGSAIIPSGLFHAQLSKGVSANTLKTLCQDLHLRVVKRITDKVYEISITTKTLLNPLKIAVFVQSAYAKDFEFFEPDFLQEISKRSDFSVGQWHLGHNQRHPGLPQYNIKEIDDRNKKNPTWMAKDAHANVLKAWSRYGKGSDEITGSIVDDGFDLSHPEIKDSRIAFEWNIDQKNTDASGGYDDWHGTSVFGVAGAPDNGKGVTGACPNATWVLVKIKYLSTRLFSRILELVEGNDISFMNWSWGNPSLSYVMPSAIFDLITEITTKSRKGRGCSIIIAAGNDNQNGVVSTTMLDNGSKLLLGGYATHPNVIAVAASNSHDMRSNYSRHGEHIHVAAPSSGAHKDSSGNTKIGVPITTMDFGSGKGYNSGEDAPDLYHNAFGGTSSSAPLVSGIIGLMLSVNPNLTSTQIKDIIAKSSDKIGTHSYNQEGRNNYLGYGRINALRACDWAHKMKEEHESVPKAKRATSKISYKASFDEKGMDYFEASLWGGQYMILAQFKTLYKGANIATEGSVKMTFENGINSKSIEINALDSPLEFELQKGKWTFAIENKSPLKDVDVEITLLELI